MNSRTWKTIPRNTIRKLALDCFKSWASGTTTRYLREVVLLLCMKFQVNEGLSAALPASLLHVCVYLSFLLNKQKVSAVSMAYAALKWVYGILPLQSMLKPNRIREKTEKAANGEKRARIH